VSSEGGTVQSHKRKGAGHAGKVTIFRLDIHAETIAEPDGEVRSLGTIPNRSESIRKLIKKLGFGSEVESLL
jgi:hypothetical protein